MRADEIREMGAGDITGRIKTWKRSSFG